MVTAFRMCFHPLIRPVGLVRFFLLSMAVRYSTLSAASSVGKCPRRTAALRNRAFNDCNAECQCWHCSESSQKPTHRAPACRNEPILKVVNLKSSSTSSEINPPRRPHQQNRNARLTCHNTNIQPDRLQVVVAVGWQHGAVPALPDGFIRSSVDARETWLGSWVVAFWTQLDVPGLWPPTASTRTSSLGRATACRGIVGHPGGNRLQQLPSETGQLVERIAQGRL
jgi:hypothetical protein